MSHWTTARATLAAALIGGSLAALALALHARGRAAAQTPGAGPAADLALQRAEHRSTLGNADGVAGFIDGVVEEQMKKFNLPGAAVVVVHGGEVVHLRGYGYADVAAGRRFDAESAVFRTASISKLFTATAALQLAEQGLIDLDADVNTYLDFRVPDSYPEPITMRHLLTHTAGFDERLLGSSASRRSPEEMLTLRQSLTSRDAAPRVRPPGQVISYSNHGMALAGYIVERLSGKPFAQYIDEHIHAPLGMTRSTFTEPLPAQLERDRVRGHLFRRGRYETLPVTYEPGAPAGSHFSTAPDIARFMLAHLGQGELEGARILGADAARRLHAQAFTHHPQLPGWTFGFSEYHLDGRRLIGHGGDLPGAHNLLTLVPGEGLGIFVHFNGEWPVTVDDDPRVRIMESVVRTLLPAADGVVTRAPGAAPGAGDLPPSAAAFAAGAPAGVTGNYRYSRHPKTSIEKLLLPNSLVRLHVRERSDGTLRMTMPLGLAAPSEWAPVEQLLYRRVDRDQYLAFRMDEHGRVTHLFPTLMIPLAFERVAWYEGEGVLLGLLGFSALGFFGVAAGWPAGALARRVRGRAGPTIPARERRRRTTARALGLLGSAVLTTLGVMVVQANTLGDTPLLPLQPVLAGAAGLSGMLTLVLGYHVSRSWICREGSVGARVGYTVLTLAGAAFVWQMAYWNVLSF